MPVKIFVSYAEDDGRILARRIANYLTKLGFIVFAASKDIMVGEEWQKKIRLELESSQILLPILTQGAILSHAVKEEVEYAKQHNIRIIPCKDTYLNRTWQNLPWDLGRYQGMEFQDEDELKRKLAKAVTDVSREIEQQSTAQMRETSTDWMVYNVSHAGIKYDFYYKMSKGRLWSIDIDRDFQSLVLSIRADEGGTIELALRRDLIDSRTATGNDRFVVLLNGDESKFEELIPTAFYRILQIPFRSNTQEIVIIGTSVASVILPEIVFDKEIYKADDKMIISVISPHSNTDPYAIDTIEVTVYSGTTSLGRIGFPETGPNTGIFEREINLVEGETKAGFVLGVRHGDKITVEFQLTSDVIATKSVHVH